jgi:hypothetical protein
MLPPVAGPLIQQALVRSRASVPRVGRYVAEAVDTPSISKWNDEPGRSQADAVAGFTAALASAAERPESQVRHLRA